MLCNLRGGFVMRCLLLLAASAWTFSTVEGVAFPNGLTTGQFLSVWDYIPFVSSMVPYYAVLQVDGNFCVYPGVYPISQMQATQSVWCSIGVSPGRGPYFAILQGDGNFCVYKGTTPSNNLGNVWCSGALSTVGNFALTLGNCGVLSATANGVAYWSTSADTSSSSCSIVYQPRASESLGSALSAPSSVSPQASILYNLAFNMAVQSIANSPNYNVIPLPSAFSSQYSQFVLYSTSCACQAQNCSCSLLSPPSPQSPLSANLQVSINLALSTGCHWKVLQVAVGAGVGIVCDGAVQGNEVYYFLPTAVANVYLINAWNESSTVSQGPLCVAALAPFNTLLVLKPCDSTDAAQMWAIYSANCPAGTIPGSGTNCVTCPAGTTSSSGATSCTPCPNGSTSTNGICFLCAAGYSSTGGAPCSICPAGTYSVSGGQCTLCPVGTITTSSGSSFCEVCPPGATTTAAGGTSCSPCALGQNSTNGICFPCPAGTFGVPGDNNGYPTCQDCFSGFVSGPGQTSCTICPSNTYSANPPISCTSCPGGTTFPGTGAKNIGYCCNPGYKPSSCSVAITSLTLTAMGIAGAAACPPPAGVGVACAVNYGFGFVRSALGIAAAADAIDVTCPKCQSA